jgi:poly(A) polymerase
MMGLRSGEEVKEGFFDTIIDNGAGSLLGAVGNLLNERGVQAHLVGGFVRDVLLHRRTADIDIAVASDALEVARVVAGALGGRFVALDEENGVARIILVGGDIFPGENQWQVDFATFRGSIEEDLARRDFTVDAMAVELNQITTTNRAVRLVDPFGGRKDIKNGVIRSVSETAFESDAVRLLRAVRLAAELGFSIDSVTEAQVQHHASLIAGVAGERIREELLRLLAVPGSGRFLVYLDSLGLLTALIPELATARGVEQPREHFWDIFEHSLKTVLAVDFLLREGSWEYGNNGLLETVPWSSELTAHFGLEVGSGSTGRSLLKLAALLHDIAKPQTRSIDENGRMRFLGHAGEGASVAAGVLERLRFSNREIKFVEAIVLHHLRPMQMSQGGLPTRRAIYRYFRDTGDAAIEILFLSLADHLATRGPHLEMAGWQGHIDIVEYVLAQHTEQESQPRPVKLIDGHDLINTLGMSPGVRLGKLLEAVREAHAAGEVTTRQEALEFVRDQLSSEGRG